MKVWMLMDGLSGYHISGPYVSEELAAQALAWAIGRDSVMPYALGYAERNYEVVEWDVLETLV